LLGYQRIPDEALLRCQWVTLNTPIAALLGKAGVRVPCDLCGEEIINRREVMLGQANLCRACAGESYYRAAARVADRGSMAHALALLGVQDATPKVQPGSSRPARRPDLLV